MGPHAASRRTARREPRGGPGDFATDEWRLLVVVACRAQWQQEKWEQQEQKRRAAEAEQMSECTFKPVVTLAGTR